MKKREDLYCQITNLRLFVGTWNLGGNSVPSEGDTREEYQIRKWLYPFGAAVKA
jgi:hypothetical protein